MRFTREPGTTSSTVHSLCFFMSINIRLHPKRGVNRHPQHVSLGCFGVLTKPFVIGDRLVFRFPDDGELMLLTNLVA